MRNKLITPVILLLFALSFGCEKDNSTKDSDVKMKVTFTKAKRTVGFSKADEMYKETPTAYYVSLKSATLIGAKGTSDFELFNNATLSASTVFNFTDKETVHSLLQGAGIPEGSYSSIKLEVYYLQMNIAISTRDRGIERRDIRIYMSDDAQTEDGLHQPGDMTQINNGTEIGWMLGEGQEPNTDPVTPRTAAYTYNGDGASWYNFDGKSGENFGPFGDIDFWASVSQPVFSVTSNFEFSTTSGGTIVLDLNVADCWQFEDKNNDGAFGFADLDPNNPTKWQMNLPEVTITVE